jgi:hypothetical protein
MPTRDGPKNPTVINMAIPILKGVVEIAHIEIRGKNGIQ